MELNELESTASSMPLKETGPPWADSGTPSFTGYRSMTYLADASFASLGVSALGPCRIYFLSWLIYSHPVWLFWSPYIIPILYPGWLGSLRSGKTCTMVLNCGFHLGLVPCWHLFCPSTSKLLLLPKHPSSQHSETPTRPHLHMGHAVFPIKLILRGVWW